PVGGYVDVLDFVSGGIKHVNSPAYKVNITLFVDRHAIRPLIGKKLPFANRAIFSQRITINLTVVDISDVQVLSVWCANDAVRSFELVIQSGYRSVVVHVQRFGRQVRFGPVPVATLII